MKWRGTLKSTILKEKTSKKPKTFSESVKKRPNYRPKNSKSQISNSKFQIPSEDGQGTYLEFWNHPSTNSLYFVLGEKCSMMMLEFAKLPKLAGWLSIQNHTLLSL